MLMTFINLCIHMKHTYNVTGLLVEEIGIPGKNHQHVASH
jgi:hypothetical protein